MTRFSARSLATFGGSGLRRPLGNARSPFVAALVALVVSALIGTAAAAAAPPKLKLDPFSGTAIPAGGGKIELNLICAGNGKQDCKGRVELLARGSAEGLDSVLAKDSVSVTVDDDADPHFALSEEARAYLRDVGPLPVTAVIRGADGSSVERQMVIAAIKLVPIGAPVVKRHGAATTSAADDTVTYTWSRKLKAATAAIMGDFRCRSDFPLVAEGDSIWYGRSGKITLTASEGVGYASFDDVTAQMWSELGADTQWNMTGWSKGDIFRNNIWAPVFKEGSFRLTVTCTRLPMLGYGTGSDGPARLKWQPYKGGFPSVSTFLPWVTSRQYP